MHRNGYRSLSVLILGFCFILVGCSSQPSKPQPPTKEEIVAMITEQTPLLQNGGEMNVVREIYSVDVLDVFDKSFDPSMYFSPYVKYIGHISPRYKSSDYGPIVLRVANQKELESLNNLKNKIETDVVFVRCAVTGRTQSVFAQVLDKKVGEVLEASRTKLEKQGVRANLLAGGGSYLRKPAEDTGILEEPVTLWFLLSYVRGDVQKEEYDHWQVIKFLGVEEDGDRIMLE